MRLDDMLPLLLLFAGLTFTLNQGLGFNAQDQPTPPPVQKTTKLQTKSLNLFVKQHEIIELPLEVEMAVSPFGICHFEPKKPFLKKLVEQQVSLTAQSAKDAELLNRLRSVEDQNNEAMVVLDDYIFVQSNKTFVSIYDNSPQMTFRTKYNIFQTLPEPHFAFKFNQFVLIPTEKGILKFNPSGVRLLNWPNPSQNHKFISPPVQLNSELFVLVTAQQLDFYTIWQQTVQYRQKINLQNIRLTYPDVRVLSWSKCKVFSQHLYCLDRESGLYRFNIPNIMNRPQRVSNRIGCQDFYIWQAGQGIQLQCIVNGQILIILQSEKSAKARPIPYFLHSMSPIPGFWNIAAYVRKSGFAVKNFKYPNQTVVLEQNEPIVSIAFMEQETQLQKQENQIKRKKNIKEPEHQKTLEEQIINQKKSETYAFILFRDRLVRSRLNFINPRISCYSEVPAAGSFEMKLYSDSNHLQILPMAVSVTPTVVVNPPDKHFYIGGLVLVIIGLIVFMCVILYYEKIERKVAEIYLRLNENNKNGKKYKNVAQI